MVVFLSYSADDSPLFTVSLLGVFVFLVESVGRSTRHLSLGCIAHSLTPGHGFHLRTKKAARGFIPETPIQSQTSAGFSQLPSVGSQTPSEAASE